MSALFEGDILSKSKVWLSVFITSVPFLLGLLYAGFATTNNNEASTLGLSVISLSTVLNIIVFVQINNRLNSGTQNYPLLLWTASFLFLLLGIIIVSFSYKNIYTCSIINKEETTNKNSEKP
ncbi:MAG: hypothetical protein GY932_08100 [Arcobacter sp.]|nr:hypothetical protein [Flavobacteriaceae bacterium]MCP4970539.1 hypothetical protein [Arcobacter sp.]